MILNQVVQQAFIICYQEDTSPLEKALYEEGITKIHKVSREYTEAELSYTRTTRCLIGHYDAWKLAQKAEGLSLIVEADFVPCVGLGEQIVPFPTHLQGAAWGWLYSCAHRVYEYDGEYIRGHGGTMVSYVIDPVAAKKIEGFLEDQLEKYSPTEYFAWDTWIRMYAQDHGVMMYLAARSYGEHGGITNREHVGEINYPNHQADILISKLHFEPLYAKGSKLQFWRRRVTAYCRAWARLIALRYVERGTLQNENFTFKYKLRLLKLGLFRLLPIIPLSKLTKSPNSLVDKS